MDTIRVLHVDDDPRFGELVAEFLEREDDRFAVVTEASAGAGLDRLADGRIDCVVSDYDMPRTDGLSFLEAVREEHSDLPFVLFTGKGSEDIAGDAMAKGATEYLQKGGGTEQYELLANRVRNAVEQYRHERERDRVYQALETATQGIAIVDPEGRFVYLNGAYADLYGYDPGDLVGERWERLSPAGAVERFREEVRPVLRREGRWSGRSRGLRADGAAFPVRVSLTRLDGGGHVRVVQDLSEEERRRHRRQRQRDALLDLTTDDAVIEGDFEVAVRRITERAADVLDADRVNVWLFEDGGASLDCVDHYDRRTGDHGTGTTLIADDYPAYFDALEANRAIDVADARSDPRTAGLTDDYLEPNGVGALLDATLRSGGEVVGVVCHEHVGDGREWTDDEIQFAADVADIVYRALRNRQRADRQRELEFQRSLLEAQQEAMLDGLVVVDDESEIISYNERFVDLWELPESVVERGDDAALEWVTDRLANPEEFREKVAYLYDHPGETSRDEIELADGRVFDRYSTPVTGDDGVHYGRLWMFRDVTDRKDRERRLERYETIIESLPVGVFRTTFDGEIVDMNPAAAATLGGDSPEEVTDRNAEAFHADADQRRALVEAVERHGRVRDRELHLVTLDGDPVTVSVTATLLEDDGERYLEGVLRDVSGRKRRERELRRKERRYQAVFEDPNILVGLLAPDGTLLDVNETALEYVDADREAVVGEPFPATPWFAGDDAVRDRVEGWIDRAAAGEYVEFEADLSVAVGAELIVEGVVRPVTDDDGEVVALLISDRDVTDRRDRERRLERQNEQFDELAEVVSHDLRTPVETVRGRLELARETGDPEHVADALAALERVDELRRELADVLRTRGVSEGTDRVDVGRVARSIWEAAAPPADASLRVDDGTRVDADREALRRLLENLIGNSLEHGGNGVRIRIGPLDGGDGFYLADDGPGIPSENREAVFDPGFSTKAEGEGVGMGMTSVRRIADAHGWTVEVGDSDALGGVRFEIRDPSSR